MALDVNVSWFEGAPLNGSEGFYPNWSFTNVSEENEVNHFYFYEVSISLFFCDTSAGAETLFTLLFEDGGKNCDVS